MKHLLTKEIRLATPAITWIFLAGALMTLLPGYPILVGSYFVLFGIFQAFQTGRENNDVLYTVLLPVQKGDFVRAKYALVCLVELLGFLISAALTAVRMTALSAAEAYVQNALMNATPLFLGFVLLLDMAFNVLFVGGFFKTAYKIGMPFLRFGIAGLLLVGAAEMLHHLPGMAFLNTPSGERLGLQFAFLGASAAIFALGTMLSMRASVRKFEKIDL